MFLKRTSLERLQRKSRQGGWLMPLAAFIIVTMGVLVTAMARMGSQSSMSVVQEQISLQAFYVAESGAQMGLSRLLNSGGTCEDLNSISEKSLTAPGMNNCSVSVHCEPLFPSESGVFKVTSTGKCGEGSVVAARNVEVGVWVE